VPGLRPDRIAAVMDDTDGAFECRFRDRGVAMLVIASTL
jgi:hypothetical protein